MGFREVGHSGLRVLVYALVRHLSSLYSMSSCLLLYLILDKVYLLPLNPKSMRLQLLIELQKREALQLLLLLPPNFLETLGISFKSPPKSHALEPELWIVGAKLIRKSQRSFLSAKLLLA